MFGRAADIGALLSGRGIHLGALTSVLATRYGDRTALEDETTTPGLDHGVTRSYVELEQAVGRLAAAHRAAGRGPGDRVLILVGNRIDIVLHALALIRIGCVAVPVNPRLKPAEIAAIVDASEACAAVADDDVADADEGAEALEGLAWSRTGTAGGSGTVAGWLREHPRESVPPSRDADVSETAILLATSGTTGLPKAAALTSHGLLGSIGRLVVAPVGRQVGLRSGRDLLLAALPLTHVMGMSVLLGALCSGVPLLHRLRFDPDETLDLVEERRPNVFAGVPTMYADLEAAGASERDLSSIQLWVSAADKMPAERARRFQRYGAAARLGGRGIGTAAFADVYGMVELSGAAALRLYPPSLTSKLEVPSVAVVLPGMEVRAIDEDGAPVGWGKTGELQFKGSGVLRGYEGRPESGPAESGWFSTGDHGRIWPGGVFAFTGRSRDRLKVGGFSVFPAEVEEELHDNPDVHEVAIVGVPDDRLGERLVALVVPNEGFDPDAYLDWAAEQVAGYRRPREVYVVDHLPRGNHGKIDRERATAMALERTGTAAS